MRAAVIAAAAVCSALAAPAQAQSSLLTCLSLLGGDCSCSAVASPISYGSVAADRIALQQDGQGEVLVSCSASGRATLGVTGLVALNIPYSIELGPSSARSLRQGGSAIGYRIYQNPARTVEWGSAAEGKQLSASIALQTSVSLLGLVTLAFPTRTVSHPTYSRLLGPFRGLVAGTYTDTVAVTIIY